MDSHSLFPRKLASLDQTQAEMIYEAIRREIQLAYETALEWLKDNGPWDLLLHLGDITGGHKAQGYRNPSAQQLAREVIAGLSRVADVHCMTGNHDTGYGTIDSFIQGGITMQSIDFCNDALGGLFWTEEKEGLLLIGVSSPIAEYNETDRGILQMQKEQAVFLGDTLSSSKSPWMLCIHNPFSLKYFVSQVRGHTQRLQKVVCGDFHDPRKWKLFRATNHLRALLESGVYESLNKCAFCPSTAPLWWRGYGLLVLSWDGERVRTKEINLNRPAESEDIPTASFWRCLRWMMHK